MRKFFVFLVIVALIAGVFYSCEKKEKADSATAVEESVEGVELVSDYDISPIELAGFAFSISIQLDEARLEGDDELIEELSEQELEITALFEQFSESDAEIFIIEFSRLMAEYENSLEEE